MKLSGKVLMDAKDESNDGNVKVWSKYSEDGEMRNPTHGDCYIVKEVKVMKGVEIVKGAKIEK